MANILIAFFSMTGETYAGGGVVNLDKGYTHIAAEYIQEAIGGDLFHIEQVREYSSDHFKMIDEAKAELQGDERPELKAYLEGIEKYDTIILAFPNWWNTLPMPVVTFMTRYDFSGMTIIPFNTSGGGGFGNSIAAIRKYAPGAKVTDGLTVPGTQVEANKARIQEWAKAQI